MLKPSARIFPIGFIIPVDAPNFDPHDFYVDGNWERIKGRVIVGVDEAQTEFNATGKTGGKKDHLLTVNQLPKLEWKVPHVVGYNDLSGTGVTDTRKTVVGYEGQGVAIPGLKAHDMSTGGGQAHNNVQPYEVFAIWKRVA